MQEGLLIVLSGPSGVGKGTVGKRLKERLETVKYSVSATTRAPRPGELDGVDYFYKTREEFEAMIDKEEFIEWAQYVDNLYGTPKSYVKEQRALGNDVILEIEVQGAMQIRNRLGKEAVFIFLAPPNVEELKRRLLQRATESMATMTRRLQTTEIEMQLIKHYDYVVVNDDLDLACDEIISIFTAEKCKVDRNLDKYKKWIKEEE